jgi:hypothetical protein
MNYFKQFPVEGGGVNNPARGNPLPGGSYE